MTSTLILGGARSGKSRLAVDLARKRGWQVLFVATAEPKDEELTQRVAAHRKSRPSGWQLLEAPLRLGDRIEKEIGAAKTVIIDCVTLLVSNIFEQHPSETDPETMEKAVTAEIENLTAYVQHARAHFIIVSNEVGLGIIPGDPVSRLYRDLLGRANTLLAERCDEVLLMVAGLPLALKRPKSSGTLLHEL